MSGTQGCKCVMQTVIVAGTAIIGCTRCAHFKHFRRRPIRSININNNNKRNLKDQSTKDKN